MQRMTLALGLVAILLTSLVSGCISENKTPTSTTSTVSATEESTSTPTISKSQISTTSAPQTTTSIIHSTKWKLLPKPKMCNDWRDNFDKSLYCALTPNTLSELGQMLTTTIAPHANSSTEKVYYVLSYGTINIALDEVKENKSMSLGHYYDIKTPMETIKSKGGSRADIALLYAGFFLNIFNEAYIYYSIQNSTAFDVEAGFHYEDINYTTLWPYPFPLPYTQYERILTMHAGHEIHDLILYRITKHPNGDITIEKRYVPIQEREKWSIHLYNSEMTLTYQNLQELQKDMNAMFLQALQSKGYTYTYNPNLQYDYQAKRYTHTYPLGTYFYTKPFHREFATGMLISLLSASNAISDLEKYHEYYITAQTSLDDLVLTLYTK